MRMTDDQIAILNQRLEQLGFETMGDYARALTEGVVGSRQLVLPLTRATLGRRGCLPSLEHPGTYH